MSTQSETVTVRLDSATKARLDELAQHTRRTRSFLASEAITDYVDRELAIVAGIEDGLADMKAGRTVSHGAAKSRIQETIERSKKR